MLAFGAGNWKGPCYGETEPTSIVDVASGVQNTLIK